VKVAFLAWMGLTLPSSGPAYGGPLKSNVRRLWSRRARSSRKVRGIALSQSHLPHKARAWSVFIRHASSRPGAHGKRAERFAPARSRASIPKFGSFGAPTFEHFSAASNLTAFEATIKHARTVLPQSLCFSCAARLPFVGRARSAHIRVYLVIEASARRFSSDA